MSAQHPTPWKVAFWTDLDGEQKYDDDEPIQDANGNTVIKTDSGVYPPDRETVAEIIRAVNEHDRLVAENDRLRKVLRRIAEGCRGQYFNQECSLDYYQIECRAREALGEEADDGQA